MIRALNNTFGKLSAMPNGTYAFVYYWLKVAVIEMLFNYLGETFNLFITHFAKMCNIQIDFALTCCRYFAETG